MDLASTRIKGALTPSQEFAFCVGHGLDHVLSITRIKEELAAFGIGDEFNKVGVATNREQEVKLVDSKHSSQVRKSNRCVVLEFESMRQLVRWCCRRTLKKERKSRMRPVAITNMFRLDQLNMNLPSGQTRTSPQP